MSIDEDALEETLEIAHAASGVTTLSYEEVIRIYCKEAAKSTEQPVELTYSNEARNRINKIISGCMTRGMSSEATTDEVWEYLRLNATQISNAQLSEILKRLEFVEDKPIGIWQRGDNSGYQTWNDGEYEISKAAKELRRLICNS